MRLADVFGISRDVPLTYVPRPTVDGLLIDNLTRDKHIVIFGSSKQGKTCLRKYNLKDDEYIVVTCSNTWTLSQLHFSHTESCRICNRADHDSYHRRRYEDIGQNVRSPSARSGRTRRRSGQ